MIKAWLMVAVLAGLSGCDKKKDEAAPVAVTDAKSVAITVDGKGFTPNAVTIKKGEKTQLVFKRTTDETCAKEVVFPEIGVKKDLPLNTPVPIDVPVDTARTLTFQCGMAMFKSKLVIQ